MMPVIDFFGYELSTYWLCCSVGIWLIILLSILRKDIYQLSTLFALLCALCISIFGIIGVFILGYIQSGFKHFQSSFMGALIFTPIMVGVIGVVFKKRFCQVVSFSIPGICLMGSIMKLGCFFVGCCGGITINGIKVPIQIIESVISLLIFFVVIFCEIKLQLKILIAPIYLLTYAFLRFFIEFFRDTERNILGISMGQFTAILVFVLGIVYLVLIILNKKGIKTSLY